MGLYFRKSAKIGKNTRVNLGTKSASISTGVKGARVLFNTKGKSRMSLSLPGTGLRYTKTFSSGGGLIGLCVIGFLNLMIWMIKIPFILMWWCCKVLMWICYMFLALCFQLLVRLVNIIVELCKNKINARKAISESDDIVKTE